MPGQPNGDNLLLGFLPESVRDPLLAAGRIVSHERGSVVYSIGQPVKELAFPLTGLVSLTVDTFDGQTVEVAIIGHEGFVGVGRYLGRTTADTNAMAQVAGDVLHMAAERFIEVTRADPQFRSMVERYVNSVLVETMQAAVCNQSHSVEQRTARWLLHASDRAGTNDLRLTHEFLSQMLSVRRPTVTTIVGVFTRARLTDGQRGLISIVDRDGLVELTCECYSIVRAATPTYD